MDLNGKNVIYLGGFGGIGRECIKQFLAKGIKNLAIFDVEKNARLLNDLINSFPNAHVFFIQLDITKKENIEAAYSEASLKMKHFDVVVNGCGILNDQLIELTVQVNLLGLIQSSLCALSYMDESKGGHGGVIVNIASVAGLHPAAALAAYSATKAGVVTFSRAMGNSVYYEKTAVRFIAICPGCTDTALLDDSRNKEILPYAANLPRRLEDVKRQTASECSINMIKAIEVGKNGSVWLLDLGKMEELEFPVFWTPVFD